MEKQELKKRVEYMLLSEEKYGVKLDIYVTEEYDEDYENVIGYKLQYVENDLGLEIIGPAKCLVPFWMIDNKLGEMEELKKDANENLSDKELEELWFYNLDKKITNRIKELKILFEAKK